MNYNQKLVEEGKTVFARNCFVCHSSKQPDDCDFWSDPTNYERWMASDHYLKQAERMVKRPDFDKDNFFSTDQRYPVTLIGTHASRSLADNAKAGRIWDNFSSQTFKNLPTVDAIKLDHPYENPSYWWKVPREKSKPSAELYGPGYYRAPSLISMWSTVPYLHNNSVGDFLMVPTQPKIRNRTFPFKVASTCLTTRSRSCCGRKHDMDAIRSTVPRRIPRFICRTLSCRTRLAG